MAAIVERLADPDCRLLTVVGPGGIGKTCLVLEAAADVLSGVQDDGFADGVFFVSLAPLQSVEAIAPTVARALGFSPQGSREVRLQLLDYLREKEMLLILDNFEHLLEGVDLVLEVFRAAPKVKIVVTSRASLHAESEYLFTLAGMTYPEKLLTAPGEAVTSSHTLQYDAVQLFLRSLGRAQPHYQPTMSDPGARGRDLSTGGGHAAGHPPGRIVGTGGLPHRDRGADRRGH